MINYQVCGQCSFYFGFLKIFVSFCSHFYPCINNHPSNILPLLFSLFFSFFLLFFSFHLFLSTLCPQVYIYSFYVFKLFIRYSSSLSTLLSFSYPLSYFLYFLYGDFLFSSSFTNLLFIIIYFPIYLLSFHHIFIPPFLLNCASLYSFNHLSFPLIY